MSFDEAYDRYECMLEGELAELVDHTNGILRLMRKHAIKYGDYQAEIG